ncbi:Metallo-dependent phosphatase-like protein [Schizophyllum amplum]|uniref:Metallo-dependent phosphatase-like protein n=1 Tax=Schizophyllum amplum TaxID=97359 RepID=A0A550CIY6_9AGAR|nr:Metallo-dependent phosphatase-like protein [Auriculariopsis ampla]
MSGAPGSDLFINPETLRSQTEVVYTEYDPSEALPPKPGDDWTRFVCISDTHNRTFPVPDGDVLLHSGDLTDVGRLSDFQVTMSWLYKLPHKTKIVIAGNHDLTLHKDWYEKNFHRFHGGANKQNYAEIHELMTGDKARKSGIVYLEDEYFTFRTKEDGREWSVYGSPWSPWFYNWAFNYKEEEAKELVGKFSKADILLTHGPPHHVFDRTNGGDLPGCKELSRRLPSLRPRIHLFGHIHEDHGARIHPWKLAGAAIDGEYASLPPMHNLVRSEDEEDPGHVPPAHQQDLDASQERTVFVNAAAWPMGRLSQRIAKSGMRATAPFGGPGFQPVVVDLKD